MRISWYWCRHCNIEFAVPLNLIPKNCPNCSEKFPDLELIGTSGIINIKSL